MAGFDVAAYLPRLLLARPAHAPRHWRAEGTLVFVDISGFTPLSDQLAKRGTEGAEDLVSTLVRIFTVLLSASDDGGDVLKFGGDAMLIAYTGPDHARRACHAAQVMQQMMSVVGRVTLTGARARLRMSTGVHTDTFDFLLPGDRQQDLVVLGAGVTRTLELESVADAGEVLVSPATATALRASELGAPKGPGVLLRRMGDVASSGSQILRQAAEEERAWRHLPTVFRERPELLASGSDHRRAAMAFVQVTGLDGEVARDPAAVLERMDALAATVTAAAEETGVTVLDTDVAKDGYRYFLSAGAPAALEDPEGRMLRTLLRVTRADTGLRVQAGCAAGRVFAGTVGAPFRCTYAAMGDTTNLAARLCAKAAPGEVLAHAPLLDRSLTDFAHGPARELQLKGKPDPVAVVPVTAVRGQRGRIREKVPFVGRERELARITEAFATLPRRGAVVQLVGEAGLGKSRLAEVALNGLGLDPVWVAGDPYGAQVPYSTLRLLLRRLLGIPQDATAEEAGSRLGAYVSATIPDSLPWLPLLAPAVGASVPPDRAVEALDERFRTARMHEAVRDLLTALLPDRAGLVVDDAHWVDETSAEALAHAFADLNGRPWAVVLTRRDGAGGLRAAASTGALEVALEPMGDEVAERLLARHRRLLRPDEVDAIVGRGAGNPYFLLQLAQEGGGSLPDTVEELIGTRIDAMEPAHRDVLRTAAVIGSRFAPGLYEAATGERSLREAVGGEALAPYLTVKDGLVAFTREVYREVAYAQLTFRHRRALHRLVAETIEERPTLAGPARLPMLSLHYDRAGLWSRAWSASRAAGEEAARAFANEEAVEFYRRALAAARRTQVDPGDVRAVQEAMADACQVAGRFEEAGVAYRAALRSARDPRDRVRIAVKAGRALDQCGDFARAGRLYRRARGYAAAPEVGREPVLIAEIDVGDAASHYFRGRFGAARRLAERAWDLASTLPEDDRVLRARARAAFLYDSAAGALDGPSAVRFREMPLRTYEAMGDHYYAGISCNNLGYQAWSEGRWHDAVAYYRRGRELSLRAGDRLSATYMSMNLAEILGLQGDLDTAEEELDRALRTFRALNAQVGVAATLLVLAGLALRRGDPEAARRTMAEGRTVAEAMDSKQDLDELDVLGLEVLLAEGRPGTVLEQGPALLERDPGRLNEARVLRSLGAARSRLGDAAAGRVDLERSLAIATEMEAGYEVARTLAALADLGGPEAEELRARAGAALEALGISRLPDRVGV